MLGPKNLSHRSWGDAHLSLGAAQAPPNWNGIDLRLINFDNHPIFKIHNWLLLFLRVEYKNPYCWVGGWFLSGNISTLPDFQLSWKSGKFQLARWSHEVVLFSVRTYMWLQHQYMWLQLQYMWLQYQYMWLQLQYMWLQHWKSILTHGCTQIGVLRFEIEVNPTPHGQWGYW